MSSPTHLLLSPLTIAESKTNPRRHFDAGKLAELASSISKVGVLQPILVRPAGDEHELVCGHRRLRAAKIAGVKAVPCIVRDLTDLEVLEIQVTENLQRDDLHPLEEAEGYRVLMKRHGYKVEMVAERVGRSVKYVYDRVKLLALTKAAQKLFLDGKITAGHAVILARLSTKDQERAIDPEVNRYGAGSGLWQGEHALFDREEGRDEYSGIKPVSVRELQAWVDRSVRLDRKTIDPMLFPETAAAIAPIAGAERKIIPITHDFGLSPDLKGDERTVCCNSWKRADGKDESKTCDHAVLGVIVVGRDRGQAFDVCTAKEKCKTHWSKEIAAKARNAKQREKGGKGKPSKPAGKPSWEIAEEKRKKKAAAWEKVAPAVLAAFAAAVKEAPTTATGVLATIILDRLYVARGTDAADALIPLGETAEDLVRHMAFAILADQIYDPWNAERTVPKLAPAFGIDIKKLLKEVAPAAASPAKKPKRKAS